MGSQDRINSRVQIRLGEQKVEAQYAANVATRETSAVPGGQSFWEEEGEGGGRPSTV